MSDGNQSGGFGSKKPKATFGDVMLGIPAGRAEQETAKASRPQAPTDKEAVEAPLPEGKSRPPTRRNKKDEAGGPMIVIRRANGVVETLSETAAPAAHEEQPATARHSAPAVPALTSPLFDHVHEAESFAEMYEKSSKDDGSGVRKHLRVGEKVRAKIFQLGADTAFLSIGGKSEAMIDLEELKDDQGILRLGIGDEVEAHVIEMGAKGIFLSRKLSKGAASMSRLADAQRSGLPVEGLVISVNKGGLEVAVGEVRAFCPASQVDIRPAGALEPYVGERMLFRVTEVKDKNVVLSRRSLLEEEQKGKAEALRKELAIGKVMTGKVVNVRDFGAFVDLGGIEGMIPVSELSHMRVAHPSDVVKVGDQVEVEIMRMDAGEPNSPDKSKRKERISLSMRSRQEDPWISAAAEFVDGTRVKGKVVRLQPFGAFVELKPGVDGLIHVSALSERRIAHPRDVVKVGDEVEVQVEKVDTSEKRVALRLVKDGQVVGEGLALPSLSEMTSASQHKGQNGGTTVAAASPRSSTPAAPSAPKAKVGSVVTGKVDRIESYGVFITFPGGKGLIPASETGTDRGTDLKRIFPLGKELTAEVIDMADGKIRLSMTAAKRSEERAEMDAWKKTQKPAGQGKSGFGTFQDLLKNVKL